VEARQAIRDRRGSIGRSSGPLDAGGLGQGIPHSVDRRNKLTHSFYPAWEGEQSSTRMCASTRGGKWKGQIEPVGLAELREVAALLAEGLEVAERLVKALTVRPEWHDPTAPSSASSVRNAVSDGNNEQSRDG
jgi:hypothetical protein